MIAILAEHMEESKEIFEQEGIEVTPIVEDVVLSAIASGFRHAAKLITEIALHNEHMSAEQLAAEATHKFADLVIACAEATNGMDRGSFKTLVAMEHALRAGGTEEKKQLLVELLERIASEQRDG